LGLSVKERVAELRRSDPDKYAKLIAKLDDDQKRALLTEWRFVARPEQLPPKEWLGPDGFQWAVVTGRGWGKTLAISNVIKWWDAAFPKSRIGLSGRTSNEMWSILLTGPSGLLTIEPRAHYVPSRLQVEMPGGSVVSCFTSEAPDSLRGHEFNLFACDEYATYSNPRDFLTALLPTLRLRGSRLMIATTPRPTQAITDLLVRGGQMPAPDGSYAVPDPRFVLTTGTSFDNRGLPPEYKRNVLDPWEGSELYRQEALGQLVLDVPGALFRQARIDSLRRDAPRSEDIAQIVVAIDPSLTSKKTSDEVGLIVLCTDQQRNIFVLGDDSGNKAPEQWARDALDIYYSCNASAVVYETSSLRDLVVPLFKAVMRPGEIFPRLVPAEPRGINKFGRAAGVSPLVNTDPPRVFFSGTFPGLENQMVGYTGTSRFSPDRLDAWVYGVSFLSGKNNPKYMGGGPGDFAIY
jgi:phage terminase large subunit-like protein